MRLVALAVVVSVLQTGAGAWTPAGTTRGVSVDYRDEPRTGIREVRATAELAFPAARIVGLVCDFTNYGALVSGVQETTVRSGTVPSDYEIYLRYAPRFVVVAARDVVVRVRTESMAEGGGACEWTDVQAREPERKGVVRMPLLRGRWTIEPLDAARSRVVYQVTVDPGGRLPGWLVRRGAVHALPDVIEQARRRLAGAAAPAR